MIWMLLSAWSSALATPIQSGHHILTIHSATRAKIPFFGWTPSVTRSVVLIDLQKTENGWMQTHTVCDIKIETKRIPVRTIIPDAFVQALPVKQYAIDVFELNGTVHYTADLGIDNVGMNSNAQEVPRTPDHPDVVDMDGDGHPGATVHVKVPMFGMAHLYVAQRGSIALEGTVNSDGVVNGRVKLGPTVQHTLDASNLLLKSSPPIRPDPDRSRFQLIPYDGLAECGSIDATAFSVHR